jgi:hypothetical protein
MRPYRFTSRRGEAIDVVDGSASTLDRRDTRLCVPGDLRKRRDQWRPVAPDWW